MATHVSATESHSCNKKPRIDTYSDDQIILIKDNKKLNHHQGILDKIGISEIGGLTSTRPTGDSDITNGDSGFQEMQNEELPCSFSSSSPSPSSPSLLAASTSSPSSTPPLGSVLFANNNSLDPSSSLLIDQNQDDIDDVDDDDAASNVSDLSCMSCLSDMSGQDWKPISGPIAWVHHQMCSGTNPKDILNELLPDSRILPPDLDNITLWKIIFNMLSEPPRRKKLPNTNTIDDVVDLIKKCNKIIVLTGAGVSVSSGIPDFRSRDGIYARLSKDFPDLPDPQAMFDIHYFRKDPRPFFKFAKEIYPGLFKPSSSHKFIRILEEQNKLLRNYTQNIDTLEQAAGLKRVITCHGSFATATCTRCKYKVDSSAIKDDIFEQRIPACPICPKDTDEMAVMKPDIVFFGEGLSDEFHNAMTIDKDECDLLIIMGSSLKVRPVALIPSSIPVEVPQILINREPLNHLTFDVELLGDCDVIIQHLCQRLGGAFNQICTENIHLEQITELPKVEKSNLSSEVNNNNNNSAQVFPTQYFSDNNKDVDSDVDKTKSDEELIICNQQQEQQEQQQQQQQQQQQEQQERNERNPDIKITDVDDEEYNYDDIKNFEKNNIALQLPDDKYLFVAPSRYLFKGAEVTSTELSDYLKNVQDDADDDTNSSSLSGTSSSMSSSSDSTSSSSLSTSQSSQSSSQSSSPVSSTSSLLSSSSNNNLVSTSSSNTNDNNNFSNKFFQDKNQLVSSDEDNSKSYSKSSLNEQVSSSTSNSCPDKKTET